MKPQTLIIALVAVTTAACAAAPAEQAAGDEAHFEGTRAALAPGKYVDNGRILMIYGACSAENFLGEAAKGAIDADGIIHAEEGDVCGAYNLTTTAAGVIKVTWRRDPTASAHHDAEVVAACTSSDGSYAMTQASAYVDPKPGTYVRKTGAGIKLTVAAGCATPSTLDTFAKSVIVPTMIENTRPLPFIQVEEGDVCNGYTLEAKSNGSIEVKWLPAPDASASHDPQVIAGCSSVNGEYTRR